LRHELQIATGAIMSMVTNHDVIFARLCLVAIVSHAIDAVTRYLLFMDSR